MATERLEESHTTIISFCLCRRSAANPPAQLGAAAIVLIFSFLAFWLLDCFFADLWPCDPPLISAAGHHVRLVRARCISICRTRLAV
jgi:hypothetical protein